jgi:hypothetical protein
MTIEPQLNVEERWADMTQAIVDELVERALQLIVELKSKDEAQELRKALINSSKSALLERLGN